MYSVHLLDMVIDKCCVSSRRLLLVSIEPTERDLISCYTTGKKMQVYSLSNPKCKDAWTSPFFMLFIIYWSLYTEDRGVYESRKRERSNKDGLFMSHQKGPITSTFTADWFLREGQGRELMGEPCPAVHPCMLLCAMLLWNCYNGLSCALIWCMAFCHTNVFLLGDDHIFSLSK